LKIGAIGFKQKCHTLSFLVGAGFSVLNRLPIASYTVHYADGQQVVVPVVYGEHVRSWQTYKGKGTPDEIPQPVWTGKLDRKGSREDYRARLYLQTWTNPRPEVAVDTIDSVSTGSDAAPFLIAITAEP
jgi:hexosaminidase